MLSFDIQIDCFEQFKHRFGAHLGVEIVAELFNRFEVGLVIQQLSFFKRGHTGIDDDETFEIKHALNVAQCHVE